MIVPKSPISEQYVKLGLPVVVVSSLDEITPENLQKWKVEQAGKRPRDVLEMSHYA